MSAFPEYHEYDGLGLAELVRSKQVTPAELIEEAISRIEAHNPKLNAVIYKMYDEARTISNHELPDGAFKGVPFLLKDLISTCEGVPTSEGNRLLQHIPASYDSELVRRYKTAGVIILGKTNTPEFGLLPYTEPEVFGATCNPWNLSLTPGGSSGGSGAAVAAHLVPLASGGDGGGSIRIPASCCGVFGLKPSRGRTPTGPEKGEVWRGFACEHVITRSVRDSAAMLDSVSGADLGAPYSAPPQARPFLDEVSTSPGTLKIAYSARPLMGRTVHDDCVQGLQATVQLLQDLGHEVEEATPLIDGEEFAVAFLTILAAEARADIEWTASLAQLKPSLESFEAGTYVLGLMGKTLGASDYAKAARYLQTTARSIARFFDQYDVLVTPTLSRPPFQIGAMHPTRGQEAILKLIGRLNAGWLLKLMGVVKPLASQTFDFIPYTPVFNVTGQPAMSVPLYWNESGIPIGMQFVGRFGDEALLYRLAGQLELARPWFERVPVAITS